MTMTGPTATAAPTLRARARAAWSRRHRFGCGGALMALAIPGAAAAQSGTLLLPPATSSRDVYDRGHNVSVTERPHPEYDPLGWRLGSFVLNPQLTTSTAYSDNVFNDNANRRGDAYVGFEPVVAATSDWSVHQLRLLAGGDFRRYTKLTLRDQDEWYVSAESRLDVTSSLVGHLNIGANRTYETPYAADVAANLVKPSRYLSSDVDGDVTYDAGRSRIIGTAAFTTFRFDDVRFADGTVRSQFYRDRRNYAGSLTYELGFTPSLSFYARVESDRNDYESPFAFGLPNRDSTGYRVIGGSNFDIAGVARGTVGLGYSTRHFDAGGTYNRAQGVSVQARADFFPDELTTVGVLLERRLIDVDIANIGTSWDNRVRVTVDHELLYNMIVSLGAEVARRDYPERNARTSVRRLQLSGNYQVTRGLSFAAELGYGSATPRGTILRNPFDELRGRLSIRIRR